MKKEEKLKTRVNAGAAYLDSVFPKWFKNINLDKLKLDSQTCCMLGQLYGDYTDGAKELSINRPEDDSDGFHFITTQMGLYSGDEREYVLLTRIWKNVIRGRLRRKSV